MAPSRQKATEPASVEDSRARKSIAAFYLAAAGERQATMAEIAAVASKPFETIRNQCAGDRGGDREWRRQNAKQTETTTENRRQRAEALAAQRRQSRRCG
jgi:hypothetical protein